ncbi:MAG: molybdopterin-dependent oxidoreductase [Nocardioides sp.]
MSLHDDPDALRQPVIREGEEFRTVSWDKAFDKVAELVGKVLDEHGPEAMAVYLGNPVGHNLAGLLYPRAFIAPLGTPNLYTASTLDQRPKDLASGLMYGDRYTLAVPDLDRTDFLIILGANPMESNGSLATAPGWPRRLRALQERGGEFVVVDPVLTRTAEFADQHLRPRVGSDAALLTSMAHVLFDEDLVDLGRLEEFVLNVDDVRAAVADFSPERLEGWTAIPAEVVRDLTRRLAGARRAVVYGRIGTATTLFGSIASWMVEVLNTLTGNLDRVGGAMFPNPPSGSINTQGTPRFGPPMRTGRFRTRVSNAPELFGELPTALLSQEIDTPGPGQYRGMILISGNPVVSNPNSERMDAAMASLDALIAVDPYITDSTRHAHVILPPPSALQRSHLDVHFAMWSVRNTARYSPAVLPLEPGQLEEWEIMCRLGAIFEGKGASIADIDDNLVRYLIAREAKQPESPIHGLAVDEVMAALEPRTGPERILDFRLRVGPYGDGFGHGTGTLTMDLLEQHPHGIDFGPMQPRLPDVLRTPTGMVDLAPEILVNDLDRLSRAVDEGPVEGLVLIGRRHLRSNNSWMHNVPNLMTGRDRSRLQMNSDDAAARGLITGSLARATTKTSSVDVLVEVTDRMAQGVVSLPHGWVHGSGPIGMRTAASRPGVNSNRLASSDLDVPSWNAILSGIPLEVSAAPVEADERARR